MSANATARYEVTVERDVMWEMRDGVALAADVYRPVGEGPFPVALARTPYSKAQSLMTTHAHPKWFARHGYIVVVQDVRGRYASEGEWYPFAYEEADGFDTVEHAARMEGGNGRVGMYGTSYIGLTQWLAAVAQPEGLVCISPGVTTSSYYDGWTYRSGVLQQAFAETWAILLGQDVARREGRDKLEQQLLAAYEDMGTSMNQLPLMEFEPLREAGVAPWFFDWIEHPTHDDYWRRWDIEGRYDRVLVPALHVGGWYDIFLDGTIRNYLGMRAEGGSEVAREGQRLVIGPWHHVPWAQYVAGYDFGPEAKSTMSALQLAWFDRWLKEPGADDDPPVRIFVMGDNAWRDEAAWPPQRVEEVSLYLHSDGRATSLAGDGSLSAEPPGDEPEDDFIYDPRLPVRSLGGRSCCRWQVAPMGPVDQRPVEITNFVLVYTGEELEAPLEVTGPVQVVLHAATSAPDTDWTAKLVDVHPDGTAINIADGIVRARYRHSLVEADPIEPDRVYEYVIDLGSTSMVFAAGHRVRLEIASSNFPAYDRNLNTGGPLGRETLADAVMAAQTVFHDAERPSRLVLPVVAR